MSKYENVIRQTPRVYSLALEVKYVARSHVARHTFYHLNVKSQMLTTLRQMSKYENIT